MVDTRNIAGEWERIHGTAMNGASNTANLGMVDTMFPNTRIVVMNQEKIINAIDEQNRILAKILEKMGNER